MYWKLFKHVWQFYWAQPFQLIRLNELHRISQEMYWQEDGGICCEKLLRNQTTKLWYFIQIEAIQQLNDITNFAPEIHMNHSNQLWWQSSSMAALLKTIDIKRCSSSVQIVWTFRFREITIRCGRSDFLDETIIYWCLCVIWMTYVYADVPY